MAVDGDTPRRQLASANSLSSKSAPWGTLHAGNQCLYAPAPPMVVGWRWSQWESNSAMKVKPPLRLNRGDLLRQDREGLGAASQAACVECNDWQAAA